MKEGFHVDKSISVGHIITTITLIIALLAWGVRTETRIELNAARIVANDQRISREVQRNQQDAARITQSLQRIEDKLDRYVEREE